MPLFFTIQALLRIFFIHAVAIALLVATVAPLLGKPLPIQPKWVISGSSSQSLAISLKGLDVDKKSKIKLNLGDGIDVGSYRYDPERKKLLLKIKSVSKNTPLGPRLIVIKIPEKTTSLKKNEFKIMKTRIWVFSPGMVKVDQFPQAKEKTIQLKLTGKNTHFKRGLTQVVFRNGKGFSVKPDSVIVKNSSQLTAVINVDTKAKPGKHSFFVRTLSKDKKGTDEIIFASKAVEWFNPSDKILDQRKIWGAPKKDWSVMLGGLAFISPDYEGSDDFRVMGVPFLDVTWRNRVFLNFQQGLGVNIIRNENIVFGTSIGYFGSREEDDNAALVGLGEVDGGVDGRLFVNIPVGPISLTTMYRRDISGSHDGAVFSVGALYFKPINRKLRVNLQGQLNFASENFMNTYFDISPTQASRSGLPTYDADAGLKDISLFNILIYSFTRNWSAVSFIGFSRLLGDAASSPIVDDKGSANQFRFGLGASYRF